MVIGHHCALGCVDNDAGAGAGGAAFPLGHLLLGHIKEAAKKRVSQQRVLLNRAGGIGGNIDDGRIHFFQHRSKAG